MKLAEYTEKLDRPELLFYTGKGVSLESNVDKPIALFSHKLDRSGAPCALFDMARVLARGGYCVFIFSPSGGELAEDIPEEGINLLLYPEFYNDNDFLADILRLFEIIILNTLFWKPLIGHLSEKKKRVFWWIHEGEDSFEKLGIMPGDKKAASAISLLAASPQVQTFIKHYFDTESAVLNCYVDDCRGSGTPVDSPIIRFLHVSSYIESNKGQLLLAKAITLLPENVRRQCAFIICGSLEKADPQVLAGLRSAEELFDNVRIIDSVSRNELFRLYDMIDVIVVPSYHETTSLIAVEGLMKEKICICSDGCGICNYLTNGENALVFTAGDADGFAKKIQYIVENRQSLEILRKNGRLVYEKNYSREVFEKNLFAILECKVS